MSDEQTVGASGDNNQTVLSHEQRLVAEVKEQLQKSSEPTPEALERMLLTLPEKYRTMAIRALAERFVNNMKLHLLDIAAHFYQSAGDEEISAEERDETLQDVEADIHSLMGLLHRLTVSRLETLSRLGVITASIEDLSQCDSAEDAQRWLYNLPKVYQQSLEREHLTRTKVLVFN
jgi:hypothetical protein